MPDLKTELEKVIHAWEQPEQTQTQPTTEAQPIMETTKPTASTTPTITDSERIFNVVKEFPGLTASEIEVLLPEVSHGSISSLLGQMAKRHLIIKSGGTNSNHYRGVFHAATDKYMSPAEQLGVGRNKRMSIHKAKTKTKAKPQKVKAKSAPQMKLDLRPTPAPVPEVKPEPVLMPSPAPQMRSVFDLDVESLTIAEARALRDKLNALFGA